MGNEIFYCHQCKVRLTAGDFEKGRAVRLEGKVACKECALRDEPLDLKIIEGGPAKRVPPAPALARPSRSSGRMPVFQEQRKGGGIWIVVGACGALAAGAIFIFSGGNRQAPVTREAKAVPLPAVTAAPRVEPAAPVEAPKVPAPSAEDAARASFLKAREIVKNAPDDLGAQIKAWERAVVETKGSPYFEDAETQLAAVVKRRGELPTNDLDGVTNETRAACGREEYARALEIVEKARLRSPEAAWQALLDRRAREIRVEAAQLYATVKVKVVEALRQEAGQDVQPVVARVSKWGLKEHVVDLEYAIANTRPSAPKTAVAVAENGMAPWERAMGRAACRDYAGAMQALNEWMGTLSDPKVQGDAIVDLESLREAKAALDELLQALAKWPKGEKLTLEYGDESGAKQEIQGVVLRSGPSWIELKREKDPGIVDLKGGKDIVIVDFGELTGKTVAALARARKSTPLLLLLEGDGEGGKGLPERTLTWARRRTEPEGAREKAAREIFYSVYPLEREYPETLRRGGAVEKYRALLKDHAETSFVKRNRELLERRILPAKEYFFGAGDMKGEGTFKLSGHERAEPCWTSDSDTTDSVTLKNFVEFQFEAPAEAAYRAWVFAGGCCLETFTVFLQGTEFKEIHAKSRAELAVEPGSTLASPLRATVTGVPRAHAAHGGGPKMASKWGWIPVPLPKYGTAGTKVVRLCTSQQGLSIGYAMISSARQSPPTDAQMRDLERAKPEETGASRFSGEGSGLVGWWKLDEGRGAAAADGSGKGFHATLKNGAGWAPGKFRTCVQFDGNDDFLEVPYNAELDPPELSLFAWVNVTNFGGGRDRDWIVGKGLNEWNESHYALVIRTSGAPGANLNIGDGRGGCTELWGVPGSVSPGTWYHLGMTYDGNTLRIYLNGAPSGESAVGRTRKPAADPLIMGKRADDWSKSACRLDDVRIYKRALAPDEIRQLFQMRVK